MEHDLQLTRQLKKLKLSGVVESLDLRILECEQNQIDYKSFLSMLLQDEIELRFGRRVQRLIAQAKFGVERTFETFDMTLATSLNATLVRELATCAFVNRGEAILLTGPPGTGKTHLAKAFGHAACRRGLTVRFFKFTKLFTELERAELKGTLHRLLDQLARVDLLIIDLCGALTYVK
jgi:DNA replication protein DnaC